RRTGRAHRVHGAAADTGNRDTQSARCFHSKPCCAPMPGGNAHRPRGRRRRGARGVDIGAVLDWTILLPSALETGLAPHSDGHRDVREFSQPVADRLEGRRHKPGARPAKRIGVRFWTSAVRYAAITEITALL